MKGCECLCVNSLFCIFVVRWSRIPMWSNPFWSRVDMMCCLLFFKLLYFVFIVKDICPVLLWKTVDKREIAIFSNEWSQIVNVWYYCTLAYKYCIPYVLLKTVKIVVCKSLVDIVWKIETCMHWGFSCKVKC